MAPQPASVRAVRRGHRQPDRRHGAREIAADLDAAPVVEAGEETFGADLGVGDDVALGVEREDRGEGLADVGRPGAEGDAEASFEKIGLLKMDFLGLRTLTLLDNAVKLIEKTHGLKIELDKIPLDDPRTFALLQRGDAKGVLQFESDGIRELLKRMKPDHIRDLIR